MRARRERERPDAKVEEPWVVVALLVGRKGLLRRLGVPAQERGERPAAGPSPGVVEWERVERVDGEVLVRD